MTFAEFLGAYGWLIALAFLALLILNKWYTAPDRARVRRRKEAGDEEFEEEDTDTPAHYNRARVMFFMNLCLLAVILIVAVLLNK